MCVSVHVGEDGRVSVSTCAMTGSGYKSEGVCMCVREESMSDGGGLCTSGRSRQGKGPNNPLSFQSPLPRDLPLNPEKGPVRPGRLASDR